MQILQIITRRVYPLAIALVAISWDQAGYGQSPGGSGLFYPEAKVPLLDSEGIDDLGVNESSDAAEPTEADRDLWPEADADENQRAVDGELALTPRELRGNFQHGLALGLLAIRPWQTLTVSANFLRGIDRMWVASVGTGSHRMEGEQDGWHFQTVTKSRAADFTHQWFVSEVFPLSFGAGVGMVSWTGSVNPSGGDLEDSARAEGSLISGFSGVGLYGFGSINLTWIRQSGLFMEYNIVGVGDTKVLDLAMTRTASASRKVVEKNLSAGQSWGFINFKIGWFI